MPHTQVHGTAVLQVTLAPGGEPSTLSAFTVTTVWNEKSAAACTVSVTLISISQTKLIITYSYS